MKIRISLRRTMIACASISCLGLLLISPAMAGRITDVDSTGGPGLGFVAVPGITTPNVDNDNQTGGGPDDNNLVIPLKRFDNVGYIDIEFEVEVTNGVTEYGVFEFVDNNTGIAWANYTMELGFGTGDQFEPSVAGDWIDFDHPDFDTPPSTPVFSSVAMNEDLLVFSNGTHGMGAQAYRFRLDVGNPSVTGAPGTFTIRQTPVAIPEPTTIALLTLAISAFAIFRRR